MTKPIPVEAVEQSDIRVMDAIYEVVNKLIERQFDGFQAIVRQDAIMANMIALGYGFADIRDNRLLDIEQAYEDAGWSVVFVALPEPDPYFHFKKAW